MTRFNVRVTRPLKLEILQFSKSISSAIFNVSWQMTTDSESTEQYLNFVRTRFLITVLVFVSRDYEPQSRTGLIFQFTNAFAIAITFARWRRRSEESTTVPYRANFLSYTADTQTRPASDLSCRISTHSEFFRLTFSLSHLFLLKLTWNIMSLTFNLAK